MGVPLAKTGSLYIGGEWVEPESGTAEAVINPATEEILAEAPVGSCNDADAAISAARNAFDNGPWPMMRPVERQAKLTKFLDAIDARHDDFLALLVSEAGATQLQAEAAHYQLPMKHARQTVALCTREPTTTYPPEVTPQADGTKILGTSVSVRQPVGVVGAITAYNFPFFLNLVKVIPSLAVGCTIVLKPSPYTPYSALLLGEIADTVGLPKGTLNIVNGDVDVGEMITTDRRIDMVTFTGSDKVGSLIQTQAAPSLKRIVMELGGKSALIVRRDANIQQAAMIGMQNFILHCGQGCALLTRQIVHNSVRAEYVATIKAMLEHIVVGDPADPKAMVGPLIREPARARTEELVQSAIDEGATLVAGGNRPSGLDKGFFFEPTLFDNTENHFRIAREEVFGPVSVVIGYDDDSEAIQMANDSEYGLGGGIFSADAGAAYEMAMQLRTGGVSINGGAGTMSSLAPFGGVKRSGYGSEYGIEGLNEFTYKKTISFQAG